MFKKLLLLALAVVVMASPAWGAQTQKKIIDNVSLTRAFRVNTHGTSYVGDAVRVPYFVTYNPTRTGVTANITADASLEGVTWGPVYLD